MPDDLVAFNRVDANAVLNVIDGTVETQLHSKLNPPPHVVYWGKTTEAGIAENAAGDGEAWIRRPDLADSTGWTNFAKLTKVWNPGKAIPPDTFVKVETIDGRYCAITISAVELVRFTLTTALQDESTADATINSEGSDNGDEITVTRWSQNTSGEIGDKGIAWKDGDTYWVLELAQETKLIRFTLTTALADESTADATINSAGPDNGDDILVTRWSQETSGEIGDRGIAWKDGDTYWVIELAQITKLVRFTLTSNLYDESTATATINSAGPDNGDEITVSRWSIDTEGLTGYQGIAWLQGSTYWIIELSQRKTIVVTFQATSTPAYGTYNTSQSFTATILISDYPNLIGDTIEVNTLGRTRVKSGMRGSAVMLDDQYYVIELQQPAAILRGTLVGNLLPADTDASVTIDSVTTQFPADVPNATSPITVDNPLSLRGFAGSKTVLQYDAGNDKYFIVSLTTFADRLVGLITSDFDSAADEIDLNSLNGLNGILSPELVSDGSVAVQNTHSWDGAEGGRARAEFNWTAEQWELYQIDCAEDQGSPPLPPIEEP